MCSFRPVILFVSLIDSDADRADLCVDLFEEPLAAPLMRTITIGPQLRKQSARYETLFDSIHEASHIVERYRFVMAHIKFKAMLSHQH